MTPWLVEAVVDDWGEVVPAGTPVTVVSEVPAPPDPEHAANHPIAYGVHTTDGRWAYAAAHAVAFPDEGPAAPLVTGTVRWAGAEPWDHRDRVARTVALRGASGLASGPVWTGDGMLGGPLLREAALRDVAPAPGPEVVVTLEVYTSEVGVTAERTVVLGATPRGLEPWLDVEVGRWPSVGELGVAHLRWGEGSVEVVHTEARVWSECPAPRPDVPDSPVERCLVRTVERWAWDGARFSLAGPPRVGPVPVSVDGRPGVVRAHRGAHWDDVVDELEVEGADGRRRWLRADRVTVDDAELAAWAGARGPAR